MNNGGCKGFLALEDGTVFEGFSIGAHGERDGEVVFNTSITGYQEILTDPSYRGQIVTMTYPMIGNVGINNEDRESLRPHVAGFIVRENSRIYSNYRSQDSLGSYLVANNIVAIAGIDTRALVRRIRDKGAQRGILSTLDFNRDSLVHKAQSSPGLVGRDLVREVIPERPRLWSEKLHSLAASSQDAIAIDPAQHSSKTYHVVCLDYGMKWNIARHLANRGNRVTVLPGTATAEEVLALSPDGVFLSNGPGDPEPLTYEIGRAHV